MTTTCDCTADPCVCWVDALAGEDAAIFGEELAEELANDARTEALAAKARQAVRDAAPPLARRTAAMARELYLASGGLRRQVVRLPTVFVPAECARLVAAAERAAAVRGGWHTDRHADHPTTDMPLAELESGAATFARERLDAAVIAPAAAHRGFRTDHLHCRDLFIVKYSCSRDGTGTSSSTDAPAHRSGLGLHIDGSIISFNVLLNTRGDFEGGGTFFAHLNSVVHLDQGEAVVHDGKQKHAGVPITSGCRYILVGFVEAKGFGAAGSVVRHREEVPAANGIDRPQPQMPLGV